MEPVLNELSLTPLPAGAGPDLDARMTTLVATIKRLCAQGMARVLRTVRDILERSIGMGVTLKQWLFSAGSPTLRETKQYLKVLLGKAPYVEDLHEEQEGQREKLVEVYLGQEAATGLGVAMLRDAPAVSLSGDRRFEAALVRVRVLAVGDEGEEEHETDVIHAASVDHVEQHRQWMLERIQRNVESGDDLLQRRANLFPSLDFCAQAERDLRGMSGSEVYFREVIRHLFVLNRSVASWTEGELDLPSIQWSRESNVTMDHRTYGQAHTFMCPDGVPRKFSLHTKISVEAKRIHFIADRDTKRILIGYVGDKLPTVRYPT